MDLEKEILSDITVHMKYAKYAVNKERRETWSELVARNKRMHKPNPNRTRRFLIGDSIEGWADAVKALMRNYFYGGSKVRFDFSDIRPKGARLITSGGKAPGPQPLRECLVKVMISFVTLLTLFLLAAFAVLLSSVSSLLTMMRCWLQRPVIGGRKTPNEVAQTIQLYYCDTELQRRSLTPSGSV
mgnify:CR=1 FL=1